MAGDVLARSGAYVAAVRRGEDPAGPRRSLAGLSEDALARALGSHAERLAFWLNVYNAAVQDLLARDPSLFDSRRRFFGDPHFRVAGRALSLDDVEHGLLRRSKLKLAGGYLTNPRPGGFERRFRVDRVDPRIHFALNCGAASCPPVAGYEPGSVDADLDATTRAYLADVVEYEPGAGRLFDGVCRVPRHFLWYRGDWGRKPNVLAFLRRYDRLPAHARPRLSYLPYDWSLRVGHFVEEVEA